MPRRAGGLRRVTVGRVVAAMRATALLTGTEMNPGSADLDALLALPSFWVLDAGNGSDVDTTLIGHDILYGRSTRWTNATAIDPSPTADATRLMLPPRASPTAKMPGRFVSSRYGERVCGHFAAESSSDERSGPVFTNPFSSRAIQPSSQRVLGSAPVIKKTWRMLCVSMSPVPASRHRIASSRPSP